MKLFLLLFSVLALGNQILATKPSGRVMGGREAFAGQFKYAAAIYKTTATGNYFCTGALMNRQWIITSGNCVEDAITFVIYLGTLNLSPVDSTGIRLATDYYVLHPDYDRNTLDNNLGLIRLRAPITFNDYIEPVDNLPVAQTSPPMHTVVLGWGQTVDDEDSPVVVSKLNYINVQVITNDECKLTYGNQITDNMVCVAGNYNEGTCSGDVGGPLIQYIKMGRTIIVGVANFISQNGCQSVDPSGFTRTFEYVDWINSTIFEDA